MASITDSFIDTFPVGDQASTGKGQPSSLPSSTKTFHSRDFYQESGAGCL